MALLVNTCVLIATCAVLNIQANLCALGQLKTAGLKLHTVVNIFIFEHISFYLEYT